MSSSNQACAVTFRPLQPLHCEGNAHGLSRLGEAPPEAEPVTRPARARPPADAGALRQTRLTPSAGQRQPVRDHPVQRLAVDIARHRQPARLLIPLQRRAGVAIELPLRASGAEPLRQQLRLDKAA